MKAASFKLRIKALFIDYLYIVLYLIILFGFMMFIYFSFLDGIPEFTHTTMQWISFLTTVLPITIFFTIKESSNSYASMGKKKVGLKVEYSKSPALSSLIRNILKFLPWQLAHISVIKGVYYGFDSYDVWILYGLAIFLPVVYIMMVLIHKDHRHIPDILSCSYVVVDGIYK